MKLLRIVYFLIATCIPLLLFSQAPSGYYNSATGTGYALKTQLHYIIDDHDNQGYGALWGFYSNYELDSYYENDGTILDIYSENPTGSDPYNFSRGDDQCGNYNGEGVCYNREHSFPKSWFDDGQPMYSDVHHLFPTDGQVNGQRGNFPYGEVGSISFESENGSLKGSARSGLGYSGTVFEPIDEFKGDLARAYFYMATRYEDILTNWSSPMLDGSDDQVYEEWALDMLVTWHQNDPVSQKEIDRNNNAYSYQGNRNPFVDHPEWVNTIWGDGSVMPSITLSNMSGFDFGTIPAGSSSAAFSYQVTGSYLESNITVTVESPFELSLDDNEWSNQVIVSQTSATINQSNTVYVRFSPIVTNSATYSKSINHSATNATTVQLSLSGVEGTSTSTGSGDLFFSEYIEGSGQNKALELFNGSSSTIDLSNYKIKQGNNGNTLGNGNGSDIEPYEIGLSGSLGPGEIYILAHGEASQALTSEANVTLTYGNNPGDRVVSFNGNDAIGLYKNDVLIDLIGINGNDPGTNWSSGSHATSEQTLIRKATIQQGNPNGFTPISNLTDEWDAYARDYFDDLGSHTFDPPSIVITWNGAEDHQWTNTNNWDGAVIPGSADDVLITSTSNSPIISSNQSLRNLELATGANLTVTSGASLAIFGTSGGDGTLTVKRKTTGNLGYSIISAPVSGFLINDLAADFIYDFDGTSFVIPSGNLTPGKGYYAAFDTDQPEIQMQGSPNTGEITVNISTEGDGFHVVGNPYAAAINRQAFVDANESAIDGNVWLWDDAGTNIGSHRGGDYIVVNEMGATSIVNETDASIGLKGTSSFNGQIGSAQGFLVKATANTELVFEPTMQSTGEGDNADMHYYRQGITAPQTLKMAVSGGDLYNEIIVGFLSSATLHHDYGLDAEKLSGNTLISLYSLQDETQYAIQALPPVEGVQEVDLGLTLAENGNYAFTAQEVENLDPSVDVFLVDRNSGKRYDLRVEKSINFYSESIEASKRFFLVFEKGRVLGVNESNPNKLSINTTSGDILIRGNYMDSQHIIIYSLDGKIVFDQFASFRNGQAQIQPLLVSRQLYVLRVGDQSVKFVMH
jgi:endonuclease I